MSNFCDNIYHITAATEQLAPLYDVFSTASTRGNEDGWVVSLLHYLGKVDVNLEDLQQPFETEVEIEKVDDHTSRLFLSFDTYKYPMSEMTSWLLNATHPSRLEVKTLAVVEGVGEWEKFEDGEQTINRELAEFHNLDGDYLCVWSDGRVTDWSYEDVDLEGLTLEQYVAKYELQW